MVHTVSPALRMRGCHGLSVSERPFVARLPEQAQHFGRMALEVVPVPPLEEQHAAADQHAEHDDGAEGRNILPGHEAIEKPQPQNAGLFVEILHRD